MLREWITIWRPRSKLIPKFKAVRAAIQIATWPANHMADLMGPPQRNLVSRPSLSEEALVKRYGLFLEFAGGSGRRPVLLLRMFIFLGAFPGFVIGKCAELDGVDDTVTVFVGVDEPEVFALF